VHPGMEAWMEQLAEVWVGERLLSRLTGDGVECRRVSLSPRDDGTWVLGLVVPLGAARSWDFPVSADVGDGERLVRDA
jgi:hypothetical protein